jgi:hypothetical protein
MSKKFKSLNKDKDWTTTVVRRRQTNHQSHKNVKRRVIQSVAVSYVVMTTRALATLGVANLKMRGHIEAILLMTSMKKSELFI